MSLIDTLRALAITVRNEKKKEANSAVRIGDLFIAIIDFVKGLSIGNIPMPGVDTYNDTSNGRTSLKNTYPNPLAGYRVVVRSDETKGGRKITYQWNGINWIDLDQAVMPEDVVLKEDVEGKIFNFQSDDEFLLAYVDSEDKVVWGIRRDLSIYPTTNEITDIYSWIEEISNSMTDLESRSFQTISDEEWLIAYADTNSTVLWGIYRKDLSIYPSSSAGTNLESINKDELWLNFPIPTSLLKVELYDFDLASLTPSKNEVKARVRVSQNGFILFDKPCIIAYQGSSSMNFEKKNFSIDLINDDGSSCKIKWGNWIAMDSYHFKAFYQDATLCRDIVSNRLYEAMQQTKPIVTRRPWNVPYDPQNPKLDDRFDTGATGHVDGFPFELSLNGAYWGVYVWRTKKNRDNYNMKKTDSLKIQLEANGDVTWKDILDEQMWERRNPTTGWNEDTQSAVERLDAWFKTVIQSKFREHAEEYLHLDTWIDYIILSQVIKDIDGNRKNVLLTTWDGVKWCTMPYDKDHAFGADSLFVNISSPAGGALGAMINSFDIAYKPEIEARYKELRDLGIISHQYIMKLVENFMDSVGYEAYKRNFERWPLVPSNRPSDTIDPKGDYFNGGCYTGLTQIDSWVKERLVWCDTNYNYSV